MDRYILLYIFYFIRNINDNVLVVQFFKEKCLRLSCHYSGVNGLRGSRSSTSAVTSTGVPSSPLQFNMLVDSDPRNNSLPRPSKTWGAVVT